MKGGKDMLEGGGGEVVGMRKREERIVLLMKSRFLLIHNMYGLIQ